MFGDQSCVLISSSCLLFAALTNSQKATSQVYSQLYYILNSYRFLKCLGGVFEWLSHAPTSTFCKTKPHIKIMPVSYASFIKASQGSLSVSCKFVFYLVIPGRVWTRLLSFQCFQEFHSVPFLRR